MRTAWICRPPYLLHLCAQVFKVVLGRPISCCSRHPSGFCKCINSNSGWRHARPLWQGFASRLWLLIPYDGRSLLNWCSLRVPDERRLPIISRTTLGRARNCF